MMMMKIDDNHLNG